MSLAIWILASFSLSGCQSTGRSCGPPLIRYSKEFQQRAAVELRALPKDSAVSDLVVDYSKVRKAIRLCAGGE